MPRPARTFIALSSLVTSLAGSATSAQSPAPRTAQAADERVTRPLRDSAAIVRAARGAQATFERARRHALPRNFSPARSRCDEIIGRFCYWDDGSTDDEPVRSPAPPESPRTIQARARLLAHLDSASAAIPGDGWIAGMHVHYLLEAGMLDRASQRASECASADWWCAALEGLAHHSAWRHVEADSAFARALAVMAEPERCAWTNLEMLIGAPLRESYRRESCSARAHLNETIWWLADPLHLRAGNDRRTEHYARFARARAHCGAASGYGMSWRDDLEEITHRYGWPSHYMQAVLATGQQGPPSISSYGESPSYHFLPDIDLAKAVHPIPDSAWTLRPAATRERYAPPYATFASLTHQASLFRRGDSVLLVVAYDASDDSLMATSPITAAVIASRGPVDLAEARRVAHASPPRGVLTLALPDIALLASVELIAGARVRRSRFGVGFASVPYHPVRMSDVAFFDPGDNLPENLDDFLGVARAHGSAQVGGRIGLYWEVYGANAPAQDVGLNVEIVREGSSWLRRAGERVGLVGRPSRVSVGWRDASPGTKVASRAVIVDLNGLEAGWYRIEVSLTPDGQLPVVARRRIELVR